MEAGDPASGAVDRNGTGSAVAETEGLLSIDEAAQYLGISKPTLYRLIGQGDVRGVKVGRQWRFQKASLHAYMERAPVAVAAPPVDLLDAELAFFAEELRRMGAPVAEGKASGGHRDDHGGPGGRKIDLLARHIYRVAIRAGASDIHLEPQQENGETQLRLRVRIDGQLHEIRRMPLRLHEALVLRYKEMAGMSGAERRLPQEGRIRAPHRDGEREREFDLRVSSVPTLYGESLVIRVLDRSRVLIGLDELGLLAEDQARIESWMSRSSGLIVCSGPAGAGKTTLVYSLLHQVNDVGRKILTVEDPVKYQIGGVVQIGVNRKAGLGYAQALRAALRQDPDILFVAETVDAETAGLVQEAAITGHLVLTTLPVDGAAEAARWLVDVGLDPLLVARNLIGIVSQRLARRICPGCGEPAELPPSDPVLAHLRRLAAQGGYSVPENVTFQEGRGCEQCRNRGYLGRVGVFEVMDFTPPLADALLRGAAVEEMETIAAGQGMSTLLADALRKAAAGVTTVEEAMRVAAVSL